MNPFFNNKLEEISEIIGQDEAVNKISLFLKNFSKGKSLFLYGPTGCGKTSSVYAFAKEMNYEILELNASDTRNAKELQDFLSKATGQMSLFATKKLILLDEIDGLSGMKDRGASKVIVDYIKKSSFPIIVTGINPFESKVSAIKKESRLVEFNSLKADDIFKILKFVLEKEKIRINEDILLKISRECNGDARAALNDLFCFVLSEGVTLDNYEIGREKTNTIIEALTRVLKSKDVSISKGAYDNVEEDLDKIFLWLDENLPKEYLEISDLSKGYDALSLADLFYGRIRKWQYYRFYVYCFEILSVGVSLAKKNKYKIPPKYKQSMRLLRYWQGNMTYAKRKTIVEKIAEKTKISYKRALKDVFPILAIALIKNEKLSEEFDLTSDEIVWLKKTIKM